MPLVRAVVLGSLACWSPSLVLYTVLALCSPTETNIKARVVFVLTFGDGLLIGGLSGAAVLCACQAQCSIQYSTQSMSLVGANA